MKQTILALLLLLSGACYSQSESKWTKLQNDLSLNIDTNQIFYTTEMTTMPTRSVTATQLCDCGTPVPFEDIYAWETVDTLGNFFKSKKDYHPIIFDWVQDEWKAVPETINYMIYTPCSGSVTKYQQYRINHITGVRQMRTKNKGIKYFKNPKNDYEKTVEKFLNQKRMSDFTDGVLPDRYEE